MLSLFTLSRHVVFNHPGAPSTAYTQSFIDDTGLHPFLEGSAFPNAPTIRFRWASNFGAVRFACATTCRVACPPGGSNPSSTPARADGDFYSRASNESVTLLVAGYNYNGNWAISIGRTFICKSVS